MRRSSKATLTGKVDPTAPIVSEDDLRLPDGSSLDCPAEFRAEMASALRNLLEGYQSFQQVSNAHLLRMLLQMQLDVLRLDAKARMEDAKPVPNLKVSSGFRSEARRLRRDLLDMYVKMGIVGSSADREDPMRYVEALRKRVGRFMEKHGLERAYACRACGHIQMVYALMSVEYRPDWTQFQQILERRGIDTVLAETVIAALKGNGIPAEWKIVHTPWSHAFLNHPTFPIWSTAVREMLEEKCECGRPKLTLEDAARILKTSVPGVDQMWQAWRQADGLSPVPEDDAPAGVEGGAAQVFGDDGD